MSGLSTILNLNPYNFTNLERLKEQVDIIIKSLTNKEVLSLCGWYYILEALLSATS